MDGGRPAGPDFTSRRRRAPGHDARLGVVVPALDEAERLPALLRDLSHLQLDSTVVVVDGGSRDGTADAARTEGAWVVRSRRGRARQLNAGAAFLGARWLLLLHADSRLSADALRAVERHVEGDRPAAGYFGLAIDHPRFFYRLVEAGQRLRERWTGLVYGDQGLLIRRDSFFRAGGYPDEPLMEDVVLNRRLAASGALERLPAHVRTSARRWEEEGRLRAFARNATLISRFLAGARPADLAARYQPRRAPTVRGTAGPEAPPQEDVRANEPSERGAAGPEAFQPTACSTAAADGTAAASDDANARLQPAALLVFAKAPRPGAVKTRLARNWGAEAAAEAYRRLGRSVMEQLADAPARTTVCFDPPGAEDEMRGWLGGGPSFVPQGDGDLGARMDRMVRAAFAQGARAVAVVGTDAPTVDAETVGLALDALRSADVVLGPSSDGGYYLIALKEPQPSLFEQMPWSTACVFSETTARCRALGLRVTCLPVETDIDSAADVTPELAVRLGLSGPAPS